MPAHIIEAPGTNAPRTRICAHDGTVFHAGDLPFQRHAAEARYIRRALINILKDRVIQFAIDETAAGFDQHAFFRTNGGDGADAGRFDIAHVIADQIGRGRRARIIQRLAARHRTRNLLPDIVIGDENARFRIVCPLPARIAI